MNRGGFVTVTATVKELCVTFARLAAQPGLTERGRQPAALVAQNKMSPHFFCSSGTQVWLCDDHTMLPRGLMVEVVFICELATYVDRFKLCNVAPTLW